MTRMNLKARSLHIALIAAVISIFELQPATAEDGEPVPQYVYFNRSPWLEKTVASADRFLVSLGYLQEQPRVELPVSIDARKSPRLDLETRSRIESPEGSGQFKPLVRKVRWDPKSTAIIVCDMWDDHTCKAAAARVAEMAPAVNRTVSAARERGVFIIHAPSGEMSFYEGTPQRRRAQEAPFSKAPVEIKWNYWNPDREGEPLPEIVEGGCACSIPCQGFEVDEKGIRHWKKGQETPWTQQIATIEIAARDAVSDNGQEIYNLLQQRGIDNVILMGVHTNICVCGRPFGLRQMVYYGKNVVLCRDLTDSLFQCPSGRIDQFRGTELIVEHIEKHICPTITTKSIMSDAEFRFRGDSDPPSP